MSLWEWLFRRREREEELEQEIQAHLNMAAQERIEQGETAEQARTSAIREFGNVALVKDTTRDMWGFRWLDELLQDLRHGLRMLAKNPGFTAVAVVSLALGIGANTAIFSYVNVLLLRPPSGVIAPASLLTVWNRLPDGGYRQHSYPDYVYYRDHNRAFSGLAAYNSDLERVSWRVDGETELIKGQLVSGNFFSVLGVKPALGRAFLPDEDQIPLRNPVVVLNHTFWQRRLGSDIAVVGKTLTLNGLRYSVVGVTPANFSGVQTGFVPDFWVPMMMQRQISPDMDLLANRTGYWLFVAGRTKQGLTRKQAQAELSVLEKQLAQAFPQSNKGWDAAVTSIVGVPAGFRKAVVPFTALLMAVVGFVLLIACANTANLLLAKSSRRSRELGIRFALGADRGRIIRQILTETTLLSLTAGAVGVGLAVLAGPLLLKLKPPMLSFIDIDLPTDWRVLAFTLLVSLLAGFAFGVAPALRSSKMDVVSILKEEATGSHAKSLLRNVLVTGQVAVCTVLLIGAGLCLRSLMSAGSVDPGFRVNNRLMVSLDLEILGYSEGRGREFYDELVEEVKALPGVRSASVANYMPLGFESISTAVAIDGFQPPPGLPGIIVGFTGVGSGYFQTMGTPLLRGREFSRQDSNTSPGVTIINEAMAQRYWPGQDPIGKQITLTFRKRQSLEIVGVAATGKYRNLREEAQLFMFRPFSQVYEPRAALVVQAVGDPKAMLAAVGLSGVVAYFVSLRTREIGIHLALGADRRDVLLLVVKQGMRLSLVGVVIGLTSALGVSRVLSSLLYGIRPTDPVTYISVAFVLTAVTLFASYLPARRATKVDPMVALRYE